MFFEDSKSKAELLLKQFSSVFTIENKDDPLPTLNSNKFPSINNLVIDERGVLKLINNLNVNKAVGPDGIPNKFLKACAKEVAPVLTNIFRLSLSTDQLPQDLWDSK